MSRVEVPDPGLYRGLDGMQSFLNSWDESWESSDLEPQELIEAGAQVVSVIRQLGRGRLSGVEVEQTLAQVWTLRGAKIVRMAMYPDREAALEAVGLRE
jgi:ketosteroid isomerase-like protein